MNPNILELFAQVPDALPFYEVFEKRVLDTYPDVTIKVKTTQVSFYNAYAFAWAWPPFRKRKGWPDMYMIVTFGLDRQLVHPRIAESVEPYPNRWTHHVLIQHEDEIDDQLMGWINESYRFSLTKGKRRRKKQT